MRIEDAPPAGWYPDPEGTSRLRWWEGTDWSDRYRARPIGAHVVTTDTTHVRHEADGGWVPDLPARVPGRPDSAAVVDEVRRAAREEAERAAQLFGAQARAATRNIQPLITEYTSKITRWFRIISVAAIVLLLLWLAWQLFVQVSLFEWIGDRIDNLTDDSGAIPPFVT